jgi:hypothetical protein
MPRHAKSTKAQRDRSMVAGLKRHAQHLGTLAEARGLGSADAVAARFQAHLDAMDKVATTYFAWRSAVREEERLESEIKALLRRMAPYLSGVFGDAATLFDFGLKPRKPAKIGVEKMLRTIEKRNATRKARGTLGKRQKKAIKGAR